MIRAAIMVLLSSATLVATVRAQNREYADRQTSSHRPVAYLGIGIAGSEGRGPYHDAGESQGGLCGEFSLGSTFARNGFAGLLALYSSHLVMVGGDVQALMGDAATGDGLTVFVGAGVSPVDFNKYSKSSVSAFFSAGCGMQVKVLYGRVRYIFVAQEYEPLRLLQVTFGLKLR